MKYKTIGLKVTLIVCIFVVILSMSSCFYISDEKQKLIVSPINQIVNNNDLFEVEEFDILPPFEMKYNLYIDEEEFYRSPQSVFEKFNSEILTKLEAFVEESTDILLETDPHIEFYIMSAADHEKSFAYIEIETLHKMDYYFNICLPLEVSLSYEDVKLTDIECLSQRIVSLSAADIVWSDECGFSDNFPSALRSMSRTTTA